MSETIADRIEENAKGVESITVDGVTTKAVDIEKQILADEHLANKRAKARANCGIVFRTLKPGGCG